MQQTTNIPAGYQLSEENKTKVCIINDIAKAGKLLTNTVMTSEEFDRYYDASIDELGVSLHLLQGYAERVMQAKRQLSQIAQYLDIKRGITRANNGDLDCD